MNAPNFSIGDTSITKIEETDVDRYEGTKEALIAVGIVRPEQWPPEGVPHISWSQGQRVTRNCRKDETYRRISLYHDLPVVFVGIPPSVRQARRMAEKAHWQKVRDDKRQKELEEKADCAKSALKRMPKSEHEFLRQSVAEIRNMSCGFYFKRLDEEMSWHGYRFSTETKEAALMAVDAIVEALVQGEVIFNADLQARVVAEHQAAIRAADPSFAKQFKALTSPNPAILEGEAS